MALKINSSGEVTEARPGLIGEDSGSKLLTPCNKLQLQLITRRGIHITVTFNDYKDGGLAKHEKYN